MLCREVYLPVEKHEERKVWVTAINKTEDLFNNSTGEREGFFCQVLLSERVSPAEIKFTTHKPRINPVA